MSTCTSEFLPADRPRTPDETMFHPNKRHGAACATRLACGQCMRKHPLLFDVTPTQNEGHRELRNTADTSRESRIAETLPTDVLGKMGAPPKASEVPVLEDPATLEQYDAWLLGIPTRYGNFPAQWKVRGRVSLSPV